jgi:hypothetical protein
MDTELNYPEEYKTLRIEEYKTVREEIAMCQREIHRTWLWASLGSTVVYTSVYLHRTELPSDPHLHLVWFVPPVLVLFCCTRYVAFWLRIRRQARYILELEKKAFPVKPSGAAHWNKGGDRWAFLVAIGIWLILVCGSVYVSWALWRDPLPGPAATTASPPGVSTQPAHKP